MDFGPQEIGASYELRYVPAGRTLSGVHVDLRQVIIVDGTDLVADDTASDATLTATCGKAMGRPERPVFAPRSIQSGFHEEAWLGGAPLFGLYDWTAIKAHL